MERFFRIHFFTLVANKGENYSAEVLRTDLDNLKKATGLTEDIDTMIACLNQIVAEHPQTEIAAWHDFNNQWEKLGNQLGFVVLRKPQSETSSGAASGSSGSGVGGPGVSASSSGGAGGPGYGLAIAPFVPISTSPTDSCSPRTAEPALTPVVNEQLDRIVQEVTGFLRAHSNHDASSEVNQSLNKYLAREFEAIMANSGLSRGIIAKQFNILMGSVDNDSVKRRWNRYLAALNSLWVSGGGVGGPGVSVSHHRPTPSGGASATGGSSGGGVAGPGVSVGGAGRPVATPVATRASRASSIAKINSLAAEFERLLKDCKHKIAAESEPFGSILPEIEAFFATCVKPFINEVETKTATFLKIKLNFVITDIRGSAITDENCKYLEGLVLRNVS